VDKTLATEDVLELVNAGIFELTVVDQHLAELWAKVLPDLVLHKDLVINSGGNIAWAVRKENPELLASLNDFVSKHRQGTLLGNILLKRYYKNTKWIQNPLGQSDMEKFEKLSDLFKKYGQKYNFDWLKIAALAYQESGFDQKAKSPAGAVGIMQILPSTAATPNVNIPDVSKLENNVHAGVKYLSFLRQRYFSDPKISPPARMDFTFAAYNAGPARVRSLRQQARESGVDPNKWFFNVEYVALRVVGRETVRYVDNINKYYIAFKSAEQVLVRKSHQIEKYKQEK
jgi:membrane-bound lytic murein transglycosylase MltF